MGKKGAFNQFSNKQLRDWTDCLKDDEPPSTTEAEAWIMRRSDIPDYARDFNTMGIMGAFNQFSNKQLREWIDCLKDATTTCNISPKKRVVKNSKI